MKFNKKTLSNGLRIITAPIKDAPSVTVLVLVEAGSKYETKEINGLSHFLEHMCFKGTVRRPRAIDISRELDEIGAEHNAFTSQEITGYYAKAHPKYTAKILDVIADMYQNPIFDSAEIEKEKGVIIEEINMYEDMPQRHIYDIFMELLYGDVPAGWPVTGPKEVIQKITRDDFVNYRKKHYVASGTIVLVAGNIDAKSIEKDIEKAFGAVSLENKFQKEKVVEKQGAPKIKIKTKDTDQTHIILGVRAFPANDERNYTLDVLDVILGKGMSSRLFQKIRNDMGAAYYVRSSNDSYTDHGIFAVSAGIDSKRIEAILSAILAELRRFINEKVPDAELRKAKDYLAGSLYLSLESSDEIANFLGLQEVIKRGVLTPEEILEKTEKVTADDIRDVAREIFTNDRLNLAVITKTVDEKVLKNLLKI